MRLLRPTLAALLALTACSSNPAMPIDDGGPEGSTPDGGGDGGPGTIAKGPTKGSAIAVSEDDAIVVACNRDAGSVSVFAMTYPAMGAPSGKKVDVDLGAGSEPWQVALSADGNTAYVVLRKSQKLVKLVNLRTAPQKMGEVAVGSEPTGLALTPTGATVYVANMVDGTLTAIDTAAMSVKSTIDLNGTLADSTLLGTVAARPALAHPRSVAITNNGDASDADESVYVTEFFAQRTDPEAADGLNADVSKAGYVYRFKIADEKPARIKLNPIQDIGFKDENGVAAGCFPNQLQSIAIAGKFAYVVSICASPRGPTGPKVTATVCTTAQDCTGLTDPVCVKADSSAATSVCVDVASVKTSTQPVVSVIDTEAGTEIQAATANLNARWRDAYATAMTPDDNTRRYPLVANDIAFVSGTSIAYLTANGSDAVFRVRYDANGSIAEVGSAIAKFIDLAPGALMPAQKGQTPMGLAISNTGKGLLFTNNDVSRNVTIVDLNLQAIQGGNTAPNVMATSPAPAMGSDEQKIATGRRLFNTGLARWSLKGQAWGACQSCHVDGLTDNVTWYFGRGPRQSTSLDGTFAKKNPQDQRVLNWTAVFDELADFEGNTRGTSGGVGAIVNKVSMPLSTGDRINLGNVAGMGINANGLNGSAAAVADTSNPLGLPMAEKSALDDWSNITRYVQVIRSPRRPSNLDMTKVTAGAALFAQKNCQGCHGGEKWTTSKVFWTPSTSANAALNSKSWTAIVNGSGFPNSLLPATTPANQLMRFASGNPAGLDQIQCVLRPVGTFGLAETGVGIAEKRINMIATAQGNEPDGKGYNPPSLLNLQTGGPFLHAGNARTLESLLSDTFKSHHQALAVNFLDPSDTMAPTQRDQLVQFLLSIDGDQTVVAIPSLGATGGSFCQP